MIFSPKSSNTRVTVNICPPHLLTQSTIHNKHASKHYPFYINNHHFSSLARSKHPQNILWIFFSKISFALYLQSKTKLKLFPNFYYIWLEYFFNLTSYVICCSHFSFACNTHIFNFSFLYGKCKPMYKKKSSIIINKWMLIK